MKARTCYIMIKDVNVDGDEGIEFGVNWGQDEGEQLPTDVEELSMAQYTTWQVVRVLRGLGADDDSEKLQEEASEVPTGILMPREH